MSQDRYGTNSFSSCFIHVTLQQTKNGVGHSSRLLIISSQSSEDFSRNA